MHLLCLPIRLWVVFQGEKDLTANQFKECSPKLAGELDISVMKNGIRYPKEPDHIFIKEASQSTLQIATPPPCNRV